MTATDRINDLTVETTQTLIDGAYLAQRQNAQLIHSWLTILEANQKETRTLVTQLIRQTQEAQSLWVRYAQDAFRTNVETFTKAAQAQVNEVSESVNNVSRQASSASKKAEANTIVTPAGK